MNDNEMNAINDDVIDEEDVAWDRRKSRQVKAGHRAAKRKISSDVDPYSAEYYWCIERGMLKFFTGQGWPE